MVVDCDGADELAVLVVREVAGPAGDGVGGAFSGGDPGLAGLPLV
jgi:hypothetical protein